jgi:hypothetical protein
MLRSSRPPALAVLPEGYGQLFDDAVAVLSADDRARALWVHGSLGRGEADASSDLDLLLAVGDEDFEAFWDGWRSWLSAITPTVLARPVPWVPGVLYALTPNCLRLDIAAERVSAVASSGFTSRAVVFDRDELDAQVPSPSAPPGPDRGKVETAIEEPLRYLALLPALLDREAFLLVQEGYAHIRRRFVELFQEANAPQTAVGMKHGRFQLTEGQYQLLEALPWPRADRIELVAAHRVIGSQLLHVAPPIAALVDLPWPEELELAVRRHLRRELAIELDVPPLT